MNNNLQQISQEPKKILEIIEAYEPIRPAEIGKKANISNKNLHKHLLRLLDEQLISKTGSQPRIFYTINKNEEVFAQDLSEVDLLIDKNYIYLSPNGEFIRGISGFQTWCAKNKLNFVLEKKAFINKLKTVSKIKKNNLISIKKTILSGNSEVFLDEVLISDFYNLDHFGKTKLGQLVYVGKTSQNKNIITEISQIVKPVLLELIKKYEIASICFIPPTIDRKIQFLDVLKNKLKLSLNSIKAVKIANDAKVPQKTLRKLDDRIINARETIAISPNENIVGNVLLIDDAAGSGATLNEVARKIKNISDKKIKVIGYAVVGGFKGFDVISEV